MKWAKDNAEKLFLAVLLLLLAAVAALTALGYSTEDRATAAGEAGKSTEPTFELGQFASLGEQIAKVHPWKAPESAHRLFISRVVRWDLEKQKIRPFDPRESFGDDIAPIWKQTHGFPIDDVNVQFQDPDEDGFTNKEEYDAKTHPKEKNSHPPFMVKLKVLEFKPKPMNIDFRSYQEVDGQMTFLVELPDAPDAKKRRLRLKKGDGFYNWVVEDFRKNVQDVFNPKIQANMQVDLSELDLVNKVTAEKLTVVYRKKTDAPVQEGTLVYLIDKSKIPVSKGGTFEFLGAKYRLLSIDAVSAKISAADGGKEETLVTCTPEELRALRGDDAEAPGGQPPVEGQPPVDAQPPMEAQPPVDANPPAAPAPAPPAKP